MALLPWHSIEGPWSAPPFLLDDRDTIQIRNPLKAKQNKNHKTLLMNISDFIVNTHKNWNLHSKQSLLRTPKYKIFHTEVCYCNINRKKKDRVCWCGLYVLEVTRLRSVPLQNRHIGLGSEHLIVFKYLLCISSITRLLGNFIAVDKNMIIVFKDCFESTMTTDCSN